MNDGNGLDSCRDATVTTSRGDGGAFNRGENKLDLSLKSFLRWHAPGPSGSSRLAEKSHDGANLAAASPSTVPALLSTALGASTLPSLDSDDNDTVEGSGTVEEKRGNSEAMVAKTKGGVGSNGGTYFGCENTGAAPRHVKRKKAPGEVHWTVGTRAMMTTIMPNLAQGRTCSSTS